LVVIAKIRYIIMRYFYQTRNDDTIISYSYFYDGYFM